MTDDRATRPTRRPRSSVGAVVVGVLSVAALGVGAWAFGSWFFLPWDRGCATSEPIADGGTVRTDVEVVMGSGDRYLGIVDVGGAWWSGPTYPGGPTATDLRLGSHPTTVTRTGGRLTMTAAGESFVLEHRGRCLD